MVKQLNTKIDELFETIHSSNEYKSYQEINKVLENNEEINKLIKEIKKLQQQAVKLEHQKDSSYKEIDKQIKEKLSILNSIPLYQEYIKKMEALNDILSTSSNQIEKYINSKI